uniref:WD_REPEATS_REGION domain-containing protein n=1 Tax=Macrostomum lignano TaxID=282301 RepID=A0A1I8GSP5_9PLAT
MLPKEHLLRETSIVSPNNAFNSQSAAYKVVNITLDLGKTLQDVKYADCSGGYVYNCSDALSSSRVRNRVLYWRSHQCTLELVEECFDTPLRSSRVKLVFSDTPVLHVYIAELSTDVYMLVCTTGGLVRFLLHHPAQLKEAASSGGGDLPYSVLHSVNSTAYQVCQPRGAPFRGHVRCATAWFNPVDCSAYAAYGLSGGDVQLLRMPPPGQQLQQRAVQATVELRQSSLFDRLLGGWISGGGAGGGGRGGGGGVSSVGGDGGAGESSADDAPTSLAFWTDDRGASLSFGGPSLSQPHHHSQQVVSSQQHQPVILLTATRDHKLRLWDIDRRECYRSLDLLASLPDPAASGHLRNRGHQLRLVRPSVGGSGAPIGCLYANFTDSPCFLALEGHASADRRLQLRVSHVVLSPSRDLIDLAVEPDTAWALYADPGGSYSLYGVSLTGAPSRQIRCQLLDSDFSPLAARDHASRFARAFGGREFAPESVKRALRLFLDENSLGAHLDQLETAATAGDEAMDAASSAVCSLEFMRSLLLDAVDTLAQDELAAAVDVSLFDDADADRLDERRACHVDRFYEQLLQLHSVDTAVCGIVADWRRSGFVGLIRRRFLGLMRPADTAELCHLLTEADGLGPEALTELPTLEDAQGTRDFLAAVSSCQQLLASLEPGLVDLLLGELLQLALSNACQDAPLVASRACQSPLVRRACHSLNDGGPLQSIAEPVSAFATLLTALESIDFLDDVDLTLLGQQSALAAVGSQQHRHHLQRQLLGAWPAGELLANGLAQSVDSRLRLLVACLLLFSELPNRFVGLNDELKARSVDLLCSMALLRWCGALVYSPAPTRLIESLRAQLALLLAKPYLADLDSAGLASLGSADCPALPAWHVFGGSGSLLRVLLVSSSSSSGMRDEVNEANDEDGCTVCGNFGRDLLPTSVSVVQHLLSPERGGLSFPLFLLWSGQLEHLYSYTGMCLGWVRSDPALLYALRGLALLNQPGLSDRSEAEAKAEATVECAASCAGQPPPLYHPSFLQLTGLDSPSTQQQQQSHRSQSDSVRASLYVHLVRVLEPLRCSEQIVELARLGLSRLADPSVQLDCIRHLVVTLSDRDQLGALLQLNFGQLGNALVSVLEMRARAVDANLHVYYNLLYCYHTGRSDFKRAASAMHELSARLSRERTGFESAQRQARALLAAIGCLRLLEPRHQWARPVRVLTLADLEHRYAILSAHLQLSLRHPSATSTTASASAAAAAAATAANSTLGLDELVADLLSVGLYHEAKCLLRRCNRAPTPLLESLAGAAVTASGYVSTTEESFAAIKEALEEEGASAEGASPADCLWSLLQLYTERYDWPGAPGLEAIVRRLLLLDYPLPAWLIKLYTERDPAGLLRLYIAHDRVEEAAELSRRLVESARLAALESGRSATAAPQRCLPYTQILQVREGLRLLGPPAQPWYAKLQASLIDYKSACDDRLRQLVV